MTQELIKGAPWWQVVLLMAEDDTPIVLYLVEFGDFHEHRLMVASP